MIGLILVLVFCIVPLLVAQELEWEQTFGGPERDSAWGVQQTDDGGYLISASTESYGAGDRDYWLIKTDYSGVMEWERTYGGTGYDSCNSPERTDDGGYLISCYTESYGAGNGDAWLIKTDSNFVTQWQRTFGGTDVDYGHPQEADDGGYIIRGYTQSYGAGDNDVWLIKTDSDGIMQWQRTYGGTGSDYAIDAQQTSDGGYLIGGVTESYGAGDRDVWLIKTDASGVMQWDQTFGGPLEDRGGHLYQTADGGYFIFGRTWSYGAGGEDGWLIKTDSGGVMQWDQTFGGPEEDSIFFHQQTADGGYIFTGKTESYGAGIVDVWLFKLDSDGVLEWERTFGTPSIDNGYMVQQTSDGGYIITGKCGAEDVWLIKTDADGVMEWDRTFGGESYDRGNSVQETEDGGYIIAASKTPPGAPWGVTDAWVIKVESPDCAVYDRCYVDSDGDDYGDPSDYRCLESPFAPYTTLVGDDCNDNDPDINPGSEEICDDGIDNDCDLLVDGEDLDCYLGIKGITCVYPPNESVLYSPPSFMWTADGGINNRFAVDLSDDWTFSWYFSTYENMHAPIGTSSWMMPQRIWNYIPYYRPVYWRVRGVDLRTDPSSIVTSDELQWFYRY
jgi:hypothetical protein